MLQVSCCWQVGRVPGPSPTNCLLSNEDPLSIISDSPCLHMELVRSLLLIYKTRLKPQFTPSPIVSYPWYRNFRPLFQHLFYKKSERLTTFLEGQAPIDGCQFSGSMGPLQEAPPQQNDTSDWRGPDDPACPYNWPMWKRLYMTSIPALLCINV